VPSNAALGCAIRRVRKIRKLTIEALGHAADVHPTYVSGIERGIRNPTWAIVVRLAWALEVPVAQLVRHAEDKTEIAQMVANARAEIRSRQRYA
jgi:transcriptional regulator with XRE-family HTH domain